MTKSEQKRFDELYQKHLRALKLQRMSNKTIDAYSRTVRRIAAWSDCCPDRLESEQLAEYFAQLVDSHSWSIVKLDRCGLQFFYRHVLKRDWQWVEMIREMIRATTIRSLPDILSVAEVERLIAAARKLRFRVFALTTYSLGLRLGETLALEVGDIDADQQQVHIRRGKGHQRSAGATAGSDLSGHARPVAQASPSALAVPQCPWLNRDHWTSVVPHEPRWRAGGHEEDAGRCRDRTRTFRGRIGCDEPWHSIRAISLGHVSSYPHRTGEYASGTLGHETTRLQHQGSSRIVPATNRSGKKKPPFTPCASDTAGPLNTEDQERIVTK